MGHVSGKIDWEHRYSNMQHHTGEHIFSGLVHAKFGYDNVGFHLSDSIVTMGEFKKYLASYAAGSKVKITYRRYNALTFEYEEFTVEVTLQGKNN